MVFTDRVAQLVEHRPFKPLVQGSSPCPVIGLDPRDIPCHTGFFFDQFWGLRVVIMLIVRGVLEVFEVPRGALECTSFATGVNDVSTDLRTVWQDDDRNYRAMWQGKTQNLSGF